MQISKNKVVTVSYNLSSNLPGSDRQHVETADSSNPLQFIYGLGMMIPGFERGLEGKSLGDSFDFSIESEDAYGQTDESAVIKLPIDIFKVEGVVDFNHPLAGHLLHFTGKILEIRDASAEEISHGHVH